MRNMKQSMKYKVSVCWFTLFALSCLMSCQSEMSEFVNEGSSLNSASTKGIDWYEKSVEVKVAGTLEQQLTADDLKKVEKLTISGNLNATDVDTFREKLPSLKLLDLKKVTFIKADSLYYGWNQIRIESGTISQYMFRDMKLISITLPEGVTKIDAQAFESCSALEKIEMPKHVNTVGYRVFGDCTSLQSVDLTHFSELGVGMFDRCTNLSSVTLPADLKTIPDYCFQSTGALKIELPASLETIGEQAFQNSKISAIKLPDKATVLQGYIFYNCNYLKDVTLSPYVKTLPGNMFRECTALESINIPNSVTTIGEGCFYGCSSLKSIQLPDKISSLARYVFAHCTNLASISIPNTVTEICDHAFWLCSRFTTIDIPSSVTRIESYAFNGCYDLSTATIPSSVTQIGAHPFLDIPNLTAIFWKPSTDVPNNLIYLNRSNCFLYLSNVVKCDPTWKNVIMPDHTASEIVLLDGNRYHCPQKFTTKKISYVRNFNMMTYPGYAGGWVSIILPFDVKTIVDEEGNEIAPFTAKNANAKKQFWLRELAADGTYKNATEIKANKPYIIAMPNAATYDDAYRINGNVTFKSTNVTLEVTGDITPVKGAGFVMQGTYSYVNGTKLIYALNRESYQPDNTEYNPGSIWVSSLRDVNPFEAYLKDVASPTRAINIAGAQTRALHPIGRKPAVTDM